MSGQAVITVIEREKINLLNEEYRAFVAEFRSAAERGWRIGQMLLAIKAQLSHGDLGPWIEEHFEGSKSTAERCMRVAREYPDPSHVTDLSLRKALEQAATPRPERKLSSREMGDVFAGALPASEKRAQSEAPTAAAWTDPQIRKDARATELLAEARQLQESAQDLTDPRAVARAYRDAAIRAQKAAATLDELAISFE